MTVPARARPGPRVALVLHGLSSGGVERVMLRLAEGFVERGLLVDLVVGQAKGELLDDLPAGVRMVALDKSPVWLACRHGVAAEAKVWRLLRRPKSGIRLLKPLVRRLPALAAYLRQAKPDAVLAAEPRYNVTAIWARRLAGATCRVVISEHDRVTGRTAGDWNEPRLHDVLRRAYGRADAIAAVSDGVADDLAGLAGIPRPRITTVYNPVVAPELPALAREPIDHPWFAAGEPPVILGVGRLHPQKDFATLIRAFARLRARRATRLVILGAASRAHPEHVAELRALPSRLGVAADVDMPGFVPNPVAHMSRAAVFVLSSAHEGLGNVLIEAMACGTPVVSTDCPSGPAEILDHGRFGPLAPVGDDAALARAVEHVLDVPPDAAGLRARARRFAVGRAVDAYLELLLPSGHRRGAAAEAPRPTDSEVTGRDLPAVPDPPRRQASAPPLVAAGAARQGSEDLRFRLHSPR